MAPALRLGRRTAEVAGTQGEGRTARERGRGRPAYTDTSPLEVFPAAHGALLAQTTHPGQEHTFQCEGMNGSVCAFVPSVLRHFIHRSLSHGLRSGRAAVCVFVYAVYISLNLNATLPCMRPSFVRRPLVIAQRALATSLVNYPVHIKVMYTFVLLAVHIRNIKPRHISWGYTIYTVRAYSSVEKPGHH